MSVEDAFYHLESHILFNSAEDFLSKCYDQKSLVSLGSLGMMGSGLLPQFSDSNPKQKRVVALVSRGYTLKASYLLSSYGSQNLDAQLIRSAQSTYLAAYELPVVESSQRPLARPVVRRLIMDINAAAPTSLTTYDAEYFLGRFAESATGD